MNSFFIVAALVSLGQVPAPQEIENYGRRNFPVEAGTCLVVADDVTESEFKNVEMFRHAANFDLKVLRASEFDGGNTAIVIGELGRNRAFEDGKIRALAKGAEELPPSGFQLTIGKKGVAAVGADPAGTFYALMALTQIAQARGYTWPSVRIRDWPDLPLRGAEIKGMLTTEQLRRLAEYRCNLLICDSQDFCGLSGVRKDAWQRLAEDARRMHIEIVPVVHTLGGAEPMLQSCPQAVEGRTQSDSLVLEGLQWGALSRRNIIETESCPIRIDISGVPCEEGIDYEMERGRMDWPYYEANGEWRIRRAPGGAVPTGGTVTVTYSFAPEGSSALCPYAPETQAHLETVLSQIAETLQPKYIHLGGDLIGRINEDLRSKGQKKTNAQVFADAVELVRSTAKRFIPDVKLVLWADAVHPLQDAPRYRLVDAAKALPKDMILGLRLGDDEAADAEAYAELLQWCEKTGLPYVASVEGKESSVYGIVKHMAGAGGNALGVVAGGGAALTPAFKTGMEKAWSLGSPMDPWAETLNAHFGANLWDPAYAEQLGVIAAYVNRQTLAGLSPQQHRRVTQSLFNRIRPVFGESNRELPVTEQLYMDLTDYVDYESGYPKGQGGILLQRLAELAQRHGKIDLKLEDAQLERVLDAIRKDKEFVSPGMLFGVPLLHREAMRIPAGNRLFEAPVKPEYDDGAGHVSARIDLLGVVGPLYRVDFLTQDAPRVALEYSRDGITYAPAQEWTTRETGGLRAPLLADAPVAARYYRLQVDSAKLREVRVFALKETAIARCPYAVEAPRLGDSAAESMWPGEPQVIGFVRTDAEQFAEAPTEVALCRNRTHLYVGVSAREPRLPAMVANMAGRDAPLWMEESFEMVIDAGTATPCRFLVNPLGAQYDSQGGDAGWNGDWKAVASQDSQGWMAVLEIPFDIFGRSPGRGTEWRVNFLRTRSNATPERSAWAHDHSTAKRFQFGTLVFE